MNKGLKTYLKLGKAGSKKIIKERKVNRFKFYFMDFASFLSCLFILPAPIFKQANISLTKQICEKNTFEISRVFKESEDPKRYWTNLMCMTIKTVFFLSGVILLGLLIFGLLLLIKAARQPDKVHMIALSIFITSMILL